MTFNFLKIAALLSLSFFVNSCSSQGPSNSSVKVDDFFNPLDNADGCPAGTIMRDVSEFGESQCVAIACQTRPFIDANCTCPSGDLPIIAYEGTRTYICAEHFEKPDVSKLPVCPTDANGEGIFANECLCNPETLAVREMVNGTPVFQCEVEIEEPIVPADVCDGGIRESGNFCCNISQGRNCAITTDIKGVFINNLTKFKNFTYESCKESNGRAYVCLEDSKKGARGWVNTGKTSCDYIPESFRGCSDEASTPVKPPKKNVNPNKPDTSATHHPLVNEGTLTMKNRGSCLRDNCED